MNRLPRQRHRPETAPLHGVGSSTSRRADCPGGLVARQANGEDDGKHLDQPPTGSGDLAAPDFRHLARPWPRPFAEAAPRPRPLPTRVASLARAAALEIRLRPDERELMRMSDRMLSDVGLTPADVGRAAPHGRDGY